MTITAAHDISDLLAPFPWFGGKRRVAPVVWERFGNVSNYVEPFAGSAAMLLARPDSHRWWEQIETINDADGFVSNFWRAVRHDPEAVARHADWPVNENDLHARHGWLLTRADSIVARLEGDPDWFDARIAGWWVWGLCLWIGAGWCSGNGPWRQIDGELVSTRQPTGGAWRQLPHLGNAGQGLSRKLPHLGDAGRGINRQLPHLGDAGQGLNRKLPHLGNAGQGLNRKLPHLGNAGRGLCETWSAHTQTMMERLSDRLRRVRVCCGDWSRVTTPAVTTHQGLTGVFLDPPYAHNAERDTDVYRHEMAVTREVMDWARERGDEPDMRIALCGYTAEHVLPGWTVYRWTARGGYGNRSNGRGLANRDRETIWFNPHCLQPHRIRQMSWLETAAD
jgi:hypothetical protein